MIFNKTVVVASLIMVITSIASSFWFPQQASIAYIMIIAIFELYLFYVSFWLVKKMKFRNESDINSLFNLEEREIYRRYYIFFAHPFAAITFSKILSLIQFSAFILTPLLLVKGSWVTGVLIGLNYFLAGPIAVRLNPRFYIHDAVEHGKNIYSGEKELIDSIFNKTKEIYKKKNFPFLYTQGEDSNSEAFDDNEDKYLQEAKKIAIQEGYASPALFQRKIKIPYAIAARLVELLEEEGLIGPPDGAKPRPVLIKKG